MFPFLSFYHPLWSISVFIWLLVSCLAPTLYHELHEGKDFPSEVLGAWHEQCPAPRRYSVKACLMVE